LVRVDQVDDRRRFASAGGTVEEQIRKIGGFDDVGENLFVGRIQDNVIEIGRSVLLCEWHAAVV